MKCVPRSRKPRKTMRMALIVAVYCTSFAVLLLLAAVYRAPEKEAVYGSLEGRFDSQITLTRDGATRCYREMEITNYLLLGVDKEQVTLDGQADFLVILSVDRRNRQVTPIMVDRDTLAMVTTYGVFGNASGERLMQISLAQAFHAQGQTGSANTASALSRLLYGVPVDHYVAVDLQGIALMNDAVGGVEVTLEDDFTALDPEMRPGSTVLLKGAQAELFVRSRMEVADGTNASRMRRQRAYLEGLLPRLLDGRGELLREGLKSLNGHYESDLTDSAIFSAVQRYADYEWQEFVTLPGEWRLGEDEFTEFTLDGEATQEILGELWFR